MAEDDAILVAVRRLDAQIQRLRLIFADRNGLALNDSQALTTLSLAEGPMTPTQLANALGMTGATVTAILDRLERAGFVRRQPHRRDRRSVQIALEPPSYAVMAEVRNLMSRAIAAAVAEDERAEVAGSLHRLGIAIEDAISAYAASN